MTNYTEWYDDILPEVNGCLPAFALKHIRDAVIDFCKRTGVLVKALDDIAVTAGDSAYPLAIDGYKIAGIRSAKLDGKALDPIGSDCASDTDKTNFFYSNKIDEIILSGTPLVDGVLSVKASVYPLIASTEVDDWIFDRYREEISDGIKWRLFRVPGKSWTDLRLSQHYYAQFLNHTRKVRNQAYSGLHNRSNKRVVVHQYG